MQLTLFSKSETTVLKEGFTLEEVFEAYFSCRSNKRNTINIAEDKIKDGNQIPTINNVAKTVFAKPTKLLTRILNPN